MDVQYAFVLATKTESPSAWSSCTETPWISPFVSSTPSPGVNVRGAAVVMVAEEAGEGGRGGAEREEGE